jgi:hypothetical protein
VAEQAEATDELSKEPYEKIVGVVNCTVQDEEFAPNISRQVRNYFTNF